MKVSVCLLAVGLLFLANNVQQSQAQDGPWGAIAGIVMQRLGSLFEEGPFELFGRQCQYKVKPSFAKFKLTYKGKAYCPGWTALDGNSRTKSKNGAVEHAISDLVGKIRSNGLVSDQEANEFLQRFKGGF